MVVCALLDLHLLQGQLLLVAVPASDDLSLLMRSRLPVVALAL